MIALCLVAVGITLFLGFKYKRNIGVIGTFFALTIGCFFLNMSPNDVFAFLPYKIIFKIVPITMFYGFAIENGTLQLLIDKIVYKCSKFMWLLPLVVFITCTGLGMAGIGAGALSSILGPLVIVLASMSGLDVPTCCAALAYGAATGSSFATSEGGSVAIGIIDETPYASEVLDISMNMWINMFILFAIITLAVFFARRKYSKINNSNLEKPAAFSPVQRKTIILMIVVIALLFIPLFANLIFKTPLTKYLYKKLDIGYIMIFGALVAQFINLASFRQVCIKRIPWNSIIIICGMTLMINVANKAGLSEFLTGLVVNNVPKILVVPLVAFISSFMSCFCSVVSVVLPTLFPLVASISEKTGIGATILFGAIFVGASVSGVSPFSTGGSVLLGSCSDEKTRDTLMQELIKITICGMLGTAVYYLIVQFL